MKFTHRLRGLALGPPRGPLYIPRCRSVHTFGMRYPLDLLWLDARGAVVRVDFDVAPGRVRTCRAARAVIEVPGTTRASAREAADAHRPASGSGQRENGR